MRHAVGHTRAWFHWTPPGRNENSVHRGFHNRKYTLARNGMGGVTPDKSWQGPVTVSLTCPPRLRTISSCRKPAIDRRRPAAAVATYPFPTARPCFRFFTEGAPKYPATSQRLPTSPYPTFSGIAVRHSR